MYLSAKFNILMFSLMLHFSLQSNGNGVLDSKPFTLITMV